MNLKPITKGIYTITNIIDGKYYVGSSVTVERRLVRHKKDLLRNQHHCHHLQRAWNKYGEQSFKFEVVLNLNHCDQMIIRTVEQEILDREFDLTYNSSKVVHMSSENMKEISHNRSKRKSGADVLFHKEAKKWRAVITIQNDSIYLGCFSTYKEALKVRLEAEKKYWTEDYIHYKRPICIPINYRIRNNKFEVLLQYKGIKYKKDLKTEEEAYEYVKKLREELGITFP
jgi:group I intron endonuclease